MLVMFRVKNFASFKDDIILDMRKTSYREHLNHTFKCGEFNLLKTIAIYGANASGKSNLISAMSNFEKFIQNQLFSERDNNEYLTNDVDDDKFSATPFLLSGKINNKIEFEIIFNHKDLLFQYGYIIQESKVLSEWLLVNNEEVFDRDNTSIRFGEKYEEVLMPYRKYREDRLYISMLDYFVTDGIVKDRIDIFKEYFKVKFNIYSELILETSIKSNLGIIKIHKDIIENDLFRAKISEYVRKIDVGIKEIVIDKETIINNRTGELSERLVPKTIHNIYDDNGNVIGEKSFDLSQESTGTLRFISFIQNILKLVDSGGVFIIDELSSRLHPLLTKFIVNIFQSDINKNNAQLIFTTHDISLMNKEQFRRDEIIIIDKDNRGVSSLYALSDLDVRLDASFGKDYVKGKYGGIPIIDDFILDIECGE